MYPIEQDTYDKVNAYHVQFQTGALTSLRIPQIIDHCSLDVEPEVVLKVYQIGECLLLEKL
jgi:hypothetical protein